MKILTHVLSCVSLTLICSCQHSSDPLSAASHNSWVVDSAGGPSPRENHCTAVLGNKIYVIGGENAGLYVDDIRIFNTDSDKWDQQRQYMPEPRQLSSASVLDGKIYIIGGHPLNKSDTLSPIIFDAATETWSAPVTTGRYLRLESHTASVIKGKIYVIGDSATDNVQIFDPSTNTWSTPATTGVFIPRRGFSSCVIDGKIYVYGGQYTTTDASGSTTHYGINALEVFDPSTNAWSTPQTTGSPLGRTGHAASVVNGKMYVFGGVYNYAHYIYPNQVDVFDPSTNTWTSPATTGTFTPRSGLTADAVNGKIYTMGGDNVNLLGPYNTYLEAFTP